MSTLGMFWSAHVGKVVLQRHGPKVHVFQGPYLVQFWRMLFCCLLLITWKLIVIVGNWFVISNLSKSWGTFDNLHEAEFGSTLCIVTVSAFHIAEFADTDTSSRPHSRPSIQVYSGDESVLYAQVQVLHVHECEWRASLACIPDRSLMSTNVSQCISECERCCCYSCPPWWDDTICHCSDEFRPPSEEHVQVPSLKGCLCVSHSHTLSQMHTNAPLELTTKARLSNCGGNKIRLRKETHKANVSFCCSSESLCFCNQEKHGIRFEILSRKLCP